MQAARSSRWGSISSQECVKSQWSGMFRQKSSVGSESWPGESGSEKLLRGLLSAQATEPASCSSAHSLIHHAPSRHGMWLIKLCSHEVMFAKSSETNRFPESRDTNRFPKLTNTNRFLESRETNLFVKPRDINLAKNQEDSHWHNFER